MSNQDDFSVAVIVSTYNNVDALRLCLYSLSRQTRMPDEIIIADDGSREETRLLVRKFEKMLPVKYVWQQDRGFRKTLILNKAMAVCTSDYIIQIDGDIIVHSLFCADHISSARKGFFIQGSRGKFDELSTKRILKKEKYIPHFYSKGLHRRLNTIRIPCLTPLFYKRNHIRGCNMSFWRSDIIAINGYDNKMVGYGREDTDITARLIRSGIEKRFLKFKAIEFHLWHKEVPSKHIDTITNQRFAYNNKKGVIRVSDGLSEASLNEDNR